VEPFVRSASLVRVSNETGSERFREIIASAGKSDVLLVGVYLSVVAWKGDHRFSKPLEDFLGTLGRSPGPVIAVAFGDPYVLGKLPLTQVVMTPFNGTFLAESSVARAITGNIRIAGRTPVTVPGRYRRGEGIVMEVRRSGN
jgi:hypothetical protein